MQDSCRALETEPSPNKLRWNDADHDEEYDNNDDDHDDDNNDADLAGDSPKEPAAKDRVGHVQRENSHGNLRRQKKYLFIDFLNSPSSQQLPRRRQNSLRGS